MKEVVDAIKERVSAPYFGYCFLAFVLINWRAIFLLITTEGSPDFRLAAFDSETNFFKLILFPFVFGALAMVLRPWLGLCVEFISLWPDKTITNLRMDSESNKKLRQVKIDRIQAVVLAEEERNAIDMAKRDEEINALKDEDVKEDLRRKIRDIRKEKSKAREAIVGNSKAIYFLKHARQGGLIMLGYRDGYGVIQFGDQLIRQDTSEEEYDSFYDMVMELVSVGVLRVSQDEAGRCEITQMGVELAEELKLSF